MMTPEQYRLLLTPEVRRTVEEQIGRDPAAIALDKRIPHAALVATQVKYLARARTKLPSYYEARCILPPLAFEQASSEACAARKSCSGERVLDLTCGLGGDALYLSKRFREVITLERDATLAAVAGENLRRLGGGAAPAAGNAAASGYAVGERVEHPKFGCGEIVRIETLAADHKLVVVFEEYGEKTLLAKFAKLTKR